MLEDQVLNKRLWLEDFTLPVGVPFTVRLTAGEVSISSGGYSIVLTMENGVVTARITGDNDVIHSTELFNIRDLDDDLDKDSISI